MFEDKVLGRLDQIRDALYSIAGHLEKLTYDSPRDRQRAAYEQTSMVCETIERGLDRVADALAKDGDE